MNYSNNPNHVRVDFFKESGKWFDTVEIPWLEEYYEDGDIHDALIRSIHAKIGFSYSGMDAVCLEPYHKYSHPIMLRNWTEKARRL